MPRPPALPNHLSHPVFPTAIQAAALGADIVARHFAAGTVVREKANADLVTDADLESERAIIGCIQGRFPTHAIMAEENHQRVIESEHLWIVDPLDGTTNFAHGIPHFAVSIGYFRDGIAQCGVVTNPITGDWYVAVAGQGAFFNGVQCRVNQQQQLKQTIVGIGFYYDRGAMMEATLAAVRDFFRQHIQGVRRFGTASLDLGHVARGLYGAYFEYLLSPWDFAAGRLLVEEAGGMLTDCWGKPLPIAEKSSILASNTRLHPAALAIAGPHWEAYQALI